MKILYSEETSGGGGSGSGEPIGSDANNPPTPPPGNPPADPPAAKIVIEGTKSERELALEQQLEAEKSGRKKDQIRLSELENEKHSLKQVPTQDKKPKGPRGSAFKVLGWED
ncbi:MAG TPA: hypothetical protein VH280_14845 [Verrucomicrobiae bacterium]|jgi:hypothetical protein|nr:hypothetical protein [Verrucomicrobiae bacterium]